MINLTKIPAALELRRDIPRPDLYKPLSCGKCKRETTPSYFNWYLSPGSVIDPDGEDENGEYVVVRQVEPTCSICQERDDRNLKYIREYKEPPPRKKKSQGF